MVSVCIMDVLYVSYVQWFIFTALFLYCDMVLITSCLVLGSEEVA